MCRQISIGAFLVSTMEKTSSYAEGSALECAWLDACQAPGSGVVSPEDWQAPAGAWSSPAAKLFLELPGPCWDHQQKGESWARAALREGPVTGTLLEL